MELRSLFIGGILPAILLGAGTVLMKFSLRAGISIPMYLSFVGATVLSCGAISAWWFSETDFRATSAVFAISMGLCWSLAIASMTYGLSTLKLPVSVVAPLTNSNALVAVSLGLLLLEEFHQVNAMRLSLGTILIVLGATVVSTS